MRVLFITRKWPPAVGGMETYSRDLTQALTDVSVDLDIKALPGKDNGDPPGAVALACFILKMFWFLITKGRQYDVIHVGDFVLAPLGLVAKWVCRPAKVLIMIHGLDILFGNRRGVAPFIYRVYQGIITWLKPADHFVANSSNTGELCVQHKLEPVTVIPLGVNTDLPLVGGGKAGKDILFLGRLVTRKGAAWFSRNVLPKLGPDTRFIVVGKTWDKSEEDILKLSPQVVIKGYVEDAELAELKRDCLLAVMPNQPSKSAVDVEGFGLVAAELSVQGIPLLASNIEGLKSAVLDQKTGFLLDYADVDNWVKNIERIKSWDEKERQAYCQSCREEAIRYYAWARVADQHIDMYKELSQS